MQQTLAQKAGSREMKIGFAGDRRWCRQAGKLASHRLIYWIIATLVVVLIFSKLTYFALTKLRQFSWLAERLLGSKKIKLVHIYWQNTLPRMVMQQKNRWKNLLAMVKVAIQQGKHAVNHQQIANMETDTAHYSSIRLYYKQEYMDCMPGINSVDSINNTDNMPGLDRTMVNFCRWNEGKKVKNDAISAEYMYLITEPIAVKI